MTLSLPDASTHSSPILDLAGLTLEVNHLGRGVRFYGQVLGLPLLHLDETRQVAQLGVNPAQTLTLWRPVTRQANEPWLAPLRARGGSHVHYAFQIRPEDLPRCRDLLTAHGLPWQEINLGTPEAPDPTLYFFDPFGHGLELRAVNRADPRQPALPVPEEPLQAQPHALPVLGLREVALAFGDYGAMTARLPRAYGLALAKEQPDRDFAQFTLGPAPEPDGNGTPRRWLYAWDPQVGLADMLGGDHAHVTFYADVAAVAARVRAEGLPCVAQGERLAARDPEGHVFEFRPLP
ncbi:VOC family protein [Deinococcus arcticus]|uniref:Bleomycin resistance protein n=1 Tax=Deinococcus arcticus TaxID=2136176 RepID=A0A2T3WA96_9DEIO|nr:VOC family protein [Deinococcus arcticus]PTA68831.1 bleomycin resistance protein [Deinococcus arcticus]